MNFMPCRPVRKYCEFASVIFREIGIFQKKLHNLFLFVTCLMLLSSNPCDAGLLFPNGLKDKAGRATSQPLAVVSQKDQSGSEDDWDKYLEFETGSRGYRGIFSFSFPQSMDSELQKLSVIANYRGSKFNYQKWTFKLLDFQSGKWVFVANNKRARSWEWFKISRAVRGNPNRFVNNRGEIKLLYYSNSARDNSQLDYLAVKTTPVAAPVSVDPAPSEPASAQPKPAKPNPEIPSGRWKPAPGASWQIQYAGKIDLSLNIDVYNLDLIETSASDIAALQARGKHVICYFSAGSYENWRPDAGDFPASVLGNNLDGWAGEKWLDVRQVGPLMNIMRARMNIAVQKGCDAVDPDNVDGYSNKTGFPISYQDQLDYNIALAEEAHKLGLAISLKNDLGQIQDLVDYFDFAVNEECIQYNECDMLKPFISSGKPVFGIEYNGNPASFCPRVNGLNFDFLKKRLSLNTWRISCR